MIKQNEIICLCNMKQASVSIYRYAQMYVQKQPSRCAIKKRCSGKMQQIFKRAPMPKFDFNKIALQIY